jgi:hypothetical protein
MWVAVQEQPSFSEEVGVANNRRVRLKAPTGKVKIPTVDELSDWNWQQTEMSSDLAIKLGFAVGSVSASAQNRTLIAEFSRTATVEQDGRNASYGVAARLVVGVTKVEGSVSVTIPVLAAQAQLGHGEASVNLRVSGYVGDKLAGLLPTDVLMLNVDTYSSLTTKMSEIVKLIGSDRDKIRPKLLWLEGEDEGPAKVEDELARAVGSAYALTQIKEHKTLDESLTGYHDQDDQIALEAIRHTYGVLLPDGDESRAAEAGARAERLLDNYVVGKRHIWLGGG